MALSDSMFLFEIIVEELKSYSKCDEFTILCKFADVFQLYLKYPNKREHVLKRAKKKKVKTSNVRDPRAKSEKSSAKPKVTVGQTILVSNALDSLITNMKNNPLEIYLCSKEYPDYTLGSTEISWAAPCIDYLTEICKKQNVLPITVNGKYNVFDEITSKRMATINLTIKLTYLNDKMPTQFKTFSEQRPQMPTGFKSSLTTALETGLIKTKYSGGKSRKLHISSKKVSLSNVTVIRGHENKKIKNKEETQNKLVAKLSAKLIDLIKSATDLHVTKEISVLKSKSYSAMEQENHLKPLHYIFGDPRGKFGNQVYCVGYFTVQNAVTKEHSMSYKSSKESANTSITSERSENVKQYYKFKMCDNECPNIKDDSYCSLDLPQEAAHLISVKKCEDTNCNSRKHRPPPIPKDDKVMIHLSSMQQDCCKVTNKIEQISGGVKAKLKVGSDPCFCSCECTFGFTKKTTYCNVCGGYELVGEELSKKPGLRSTFPCPIFHKLVDKNKLKTCSSGSDSRRRGDDSQKSFKTGSKSDKRSIAEDKNGESEKENKNGKNKRKDERFQFNYGYKAPQIGHSQCAMPCSGTLGVVPKHMGWLWTAEDIPGLKFRPLWRPGAVNKNVVRLLRIARNPGQVMAKRRRKEVKKRPLKRPLIVVHKKDGEFTVTMETMKAYSKPRGPNQQPYEEKPLVTYTIGRSEEENLERRKKKERAQRRLERDQREFIQSAFKDMCQEICLKTYQQALGILPDTEDPECSCYPAQPGPDRTNMDISCSCSEDSISLGSDTDSDEWLVEFTPPNAFYDPTYKGKKVQKVDNGSQYNYLDYRVKLLDRYGNPVPRFFRGPDGKQQCSDLGGFWSPDHKWLEINVDGMIAPDNRWAPNSFIGPNGEQIDTEDGKFQAGNLKWYIIGVDGYVDCNGRWRFYPKPRSSATQKKNRPAPKKVDKKSDVTKLEIPQPEAPWSCFGDASPKELSKMGIVGHGFDRKLLIDTLKHMAARGEDVTIPQPSVVPRSPVLKSGKKSRSARTITNDHFPERAYCNHKVPSSKGVTVDARGNKVYFKPRDYKNKRPNERLETLTEKGFSLSSFHEPCFHSFINSDIMKQQQRDRLMNLSAQGRSIATQV